jgi:ATP-dependent Lon protease
MEEHGLPVDRIVWSPAALEGIIAHYTQEAGVRNLERQIAAICRKMARRAAEGDPAPARLTARHSREEPSPGGEIGVSNGLAWTETGGEVLRVEAAATRGRELVLTGQLGDVMKESGQAALTYARTCLERWGLDEARLVRREVHVHVPAGAIPKDGPSAGITIATALRGRVLPVGGVREKALAALRAGISRVILPARNMQDLVEIPRELKRRLTFIPVSHMDEVLEAALERSPLSSRSRRALARSRSAPSAPLSAQRR